MKIHFKLAITKMHPKSALPHTPSWI